MDAKKITAKLRGETVRQRTSLYLDGNVYKEFRKVCGDLSPSKVIEELMKEFIQSSLNQKKKVKKAKVQKN